MLLLGAMLLVPAGGCKDKTAKKTKPDKNIKALKKSGEQLKATTSELLRRRGKLTNHMVFGEAFAILAGDGLLNMVEMAFRAYDPCFSCATHTLPGSMPLVVDVVDSRGEVVKQLRR